MSFCNPLFPRATRFGDVLKTGSIELEEKMNDHVNPLMANILNAHAAIIPQAPEEVKPACLLCGGKKDVHPWYLIPSANLCIDCRNRPRGHLDVRIHLRCSHRFDGHHDA